MSMDLPQLAEAYDVLEQLATDVNPTIAAAAARALRIYHLRPTEVATTIQTTQQGTTPDRLAAIEELGSMIRSTGA